MGQYTLLTRTGSGSVVKIRGLARTQNVGIRTSLISQCVCGHSAQVGDGQTVRLSLLSFGGRLSSHGDVDSVESPTKTCYEVGAVQVTDTAQHRSGNGYRK